MEQIIEDKELGILRIRTLQRARRLTFRTKADAIYVSVPPCTSQKEIEQAIRQLRPQLLLARSKRKRPFIDLNYRIHADYIKLSLVQGVMPRFLVRSESGDTQIVCPPKTDFDNERLQEWLRQVMVEALRSRAKAVLPSRLQFLASRHGLVYHSVKINSSSGRWGSCSGTQSINLSLYLMLLPSHLIDYVLLHELAHTREMNHGERFWKLLDRLTEGKALALRKELRSYRIEFPLG